MIENNEKLENGYDNFDDGNEKHMKIISKLILILSILNVILASSTIAFSIINILILQ